VYTQDFDPVSNSLGLSSIFAVLPILALFILLGGLRLAAQWAALVALGTAMLVAMIVYGMPVDQTALSATEGAAFGLFPIMWIVVTAIWIYNMTEATGHFAVLRRAFSGISRDQRIQAVIIAFCFGALLEAFDYGPPPHGGIALGIDRWAALFANQTNIREAMVFPKTQSGSDLMLEAPSAPDPAQYAELGLRYVGFATRPDDADA